MKLNIKPWKFALLCIVMLADLFLFGWLLSKIPWIGMLEGPELVLHGLWLALFGAYLFTTRKKWAEKHPRGVRIGEKLHVAAVVCLSLSVILRTAFQFAGI